MFNYRDDVVTHPQGQEFAAVKGLGKVEQPFMPKLAESLAEAVAHDDEAKAEVDREVLARMIQIVSKQIASSFKAKLCDELFPDAMFLANPADLDQYPQEAMLIAIGPVKALPRMQVCACVLEKRRRLTIPCCFSGQGGRRR